MRILILVLAVALAGCRAATEPVVATRALPQTESTMPADGPFDTSMVRVRAVVGHGQLLVLATVREPAADTMSFQVFVDSDENRATGYTGRGWDYLARGPLVDPEGLVVRSTDAVKGNPGGWGNVTGAFAGRISRRNVSALIPLSALGGDDGRLVLGVAVYARRNGQWQAYGWTYDVTPMGQQPGLHRRTVNTEAPSAPPQPNVERRG